MNNEKNKIFKFVLIFILIVVCLISFLVSSNSNEDGGSSSSSSSSDTNAIIERAQQESKAVKSDEKKDFTQIGIDEYLEMYNGSDNKIVLIARPTCSFCQIAEPIIQNVAYKYDVNIYYLNTDDFSDDDESSLIQSDGAFSNGYGTPMLLLVSNGKIVDKVDGLTDTSGYLKFLETNGIINK